ncbi:hypothetical protein F5141DRAFT_1131622 [Pisolithus sp. B1]|nr:hypothetical protein F5141DRAFT_1131622 [Pisolithus sp. B1]
MPRIPYLSTPAPGLYRQGNTRVTRSASSLASNVSPNRLRRVYAYTSSLVLAVIAACAAPINAPPCQLRLAVGANTCPHGPGGTPLYRVPVSFLVSLFHVLPMAFRLQSYRARTFAFPHISSLRSRIVHASLSRLRLSLLFIRGAYMHITIFDRFFLPLRLLLYVFSLLSRLFVPWRDSRRII